MASLKITAADFVVYLKPGGGCGSSCSDSQGVLARKGWHCFETEGANGSTLVVTRQPIGKDDWITSRWNTYFKGPLVEVSTAYAGTSGRFEVAAICARVFPAQKAYVQYVIHENIRPASDFPFGAYAADKLTHRNANTVEFHTPANSDGLGTANLVARNGDPVDGVVMLDVLDGVVLELCKFQSDFRKVNAISSQRSFNNLSVIMLEANISNT